MKRIIVTEIARNYGGNGHVKAAGCKMTLDQFENF
jgi:nanoRNase/pAp phosphatase (c-di-AMP/oligoRNAs hydrolase)